MNKRTQNLVVTPSELGEYVKYKQCPRYAKLRNGGTGEENARDWKEAFNSLNPMLSEEGRKFEDGVYDDVRKLAHDTIEEWRDYDSQEENNETLREAVIETAQRDAGDAPLLLMQAHFAGEIGAFFVPGDSDLIAIWPRGDNHVHIRIFDIKASFDEKTYHQIQTACYTILYDAVLGHTDVPDDLTYEIDAGIIYRESDWGELTTETLPEFEPAPREADVARLLQPDGELESVYTRNLEDIDYQLDSACQTCPYNESCFTRSVESGDIRLLGLTRGEQRAFRKYGLDSLEDVAELIDPMDDPRPYEYGDPDIRPQYREAVTKLAENHSIGERLPRLAQKAQALLGDLNPDHPDAHDAPWMPWVKGAGEGSLPDDDPKFDKDDMSIERGSLIRVYLNVQWDYLRDRISVFSGRITCSNYDGTPLTFSKIVSEKGMSEDETEQSDDEERILKEGFERMFEAIRLVARMSGQTDAAPVHLYFYGRGERDALMDAVKRHPSLTSAGAVRDLLGLRPGIDQAMVSVLQEEVNTRLAPKQIATGILPVMNDFHPSGSGKFEFSDWTYTNSSDRTVNLRQTFYHALFDYRVPFKRDGDAIRLLLGKNDEEEDGWYPSRGRFGAEIPLEYIWAADGIDELTPDWTDDAQYKGIIELFRWRDQNNTERITTEDVKELSKRFAHALHHIERGIVFKNTDMEKHAIPLPELDAFSLGEATLAKACKEYLDLEYATSKQDTMALYRQPMKDRILNGESIPVEIENAEVNDGFMRATGHLILDEFGFANPDRVAMASRVKGGDEGATGSWMVATELRELDDGTLVQGVGNPEKIENGAPLTVDSFNPRTGAVELIAFPNGGKKDHDYRTWHKRWTEDASESFNTYIGPGQKLILDPHADDMTAERAGNALEHAEKSALYNLIQDIASGTNTTPTTDAFDQDALNEYVEYCKTEPDPSPNPEQRDFIGEGTAQVSLLQGPPGTGKTSGALSHALLGRAYAKNAKGEHLRAVVTGASNKSVDELLEDVATNLDEFIRTSTSDALDDVKLVRFVGDPPANPLSGVEYINYHEDEDALQRLEQRLQASGARQTTLGESQDSQPHVIVFTTPSRVAGYMGKHSVVGYPNDPYELSPKMFDCFAMDEASMLPLPQFLLAGAFITTDCQVLVGGDQRQMPPVQKHDWSLEDRRTVEQAAPYLSTLDFFRLMRGDDVEGVEDEVIDASPKADIPIARLKETYRCHTTVAEFLRRWVYAQDDIDYQSDQTYTIPETTGPTDGLTEAVRADRPLTLILHDDASSQQSNITEARMAKMLVDALPDSETMGIVTPHNSQKGLLSAMCDPKAHVDTVERFQGGQRDVMLLSATVSDPDYLNAESDFILNPNRLNVALSRMKKKLIVIAPKTLFNVLPGDIDEYNDSTIWKGLYHEVHADGDANWKGSVSDFTGNADDGDDVNVWVYGK